MFLYFSDQQGFLLVKQEDIFSLNVCSNLTFFLGKSTNCANLVTNSTTPVEPKRSLWVHREFVCTRPARLDLV